MFYVQNFKFKFCVPYTRSSLYREGLSAEKSVKMGHRF
jgi:hypothetical protein